MNQVDRCTALSGQPTRVFASTNPARPLTVRSLRRAPPVQLPGLRPSRAGASQTPRVAPSGESSRQTNFAPLGSPWNREHAEARADHQLEEFGLRVDQEFNERQMSRERLTGVRVREYNTDMGPMPSEGGARSAWRAGLSVALCLSILGMADAASGQSLRNGFYAGLEMGRANASPLTSSVTGVNHPTRCDRLLYPASTSPPASDEACRASTPTVILRNAFDLGGGAVSGLLVGYRADRVRVEVEYLTRSQGPATAAVGATTNVVLQGKDTEWSHDQPPREWIRDYAAHQIFANAYYDFPNESPWTPYVGGGLGVAITTLHYANQFIRKPDAEYLRIDFEPDLRLSTKSGPPVIPKSGPPAIDGRSYFVSSRNLMMAVGARGEPSAVLQGPVGAFCASTGPAASTASCGSAFLLPLFERAAKPIGLVAGVDDVRAIGDAIQHGLAQARVRDHLGPFRKWQIRRQDERGALGPVGDDLEQQLRPDIGERDVAHLVNRDHVIPRPPGEHAGELHRVLRLDQLVDQRGGGSEPHAPFLPTRRHAEAGEEMGLAGPTIADEHDRFGALDVTPVGERANLRRRDLRRLAEVKLVEGLDARQVRVLQPARDRMSLALLDLGGKQRFQIAEMRVALAHGLRGERSTLPADGRKMEHFAVLEDRGLVDGERGRAHRVPACDSSVSYAAMLGSGRS